MDSRKKITAVVVVFLLAFILVIFWQTKKEIISILPITKNDKKISIVATFYPLEEFARAAGGDTISVEDIVPVGTEPHDYEPTPRDIASIYKSDIFILNGAGLDAWAEKIVPELEKRGVKVLQMSEVIGPYSSDIADPHFWLDPVLAQKEVEAISETLTARDPARKEIYERNTNNYFAELADLDLAYLNGLRKCQTHTIVTSHNAFVYLAKRYGFEIISTGGFSEEMEVSLRDISQIVEKMRKQNLQYVFFAALDSPKIAETIAKEAGAKTVIFNPVEGLTEEEKQAGKNYLSIMRENLNNLQTAMQCQK
jgi:zinc transport system substrate-binding protein